MTCIPTSRNESSSSSTSSSTLGVASLLNFSHSNRHLEVSHDFNLQSPDDWYCSGSVMGLLPPYIFSSEVSVQAFCHFFYWVICDFWWVFFFFWYFVLFCFVLSVWEFLMYSRCKFFIRYMLCKCFCPLWGLSFHSLNSTFWKEVFTFYGLQFSHLSFYGSCFWCYI